MKKVVISLFVMFLLALSLLSFTSAGVGISWDQETALVPENSDVCLTYGVYNPWPEDSYVKIQLSDSLQEIIAYSEGEIESIPKYTFSNSSIPVKFCFRTPSVYQKDCLLFNSLLCSQSCEEEMKVYSGQVEVVEVSESQLGNGGGSATTMTVSAPLKVKVNCLPHTTDYSLVYAVIGILALLILAWRLFWANRAKKKVKKK
ncbi:MAG: hypothetical protein Q8Q04_02535 [archaeon]|nr:hypothetical protein [archaeon]